MSHHYTQARLAAYLHHELSERDAARVQAHLAACDACRADLAGMAEADRLLEASRATAQAPTHLWSQIEARGLAAPRRRAVSGLVLRAVAYGCLALVMVQAYRVRSGSIAQLWQLRSGPTEVRPASVKPSIAWEVARVSGAPRIGAAAMPAAGRLVQGQWLETDAASRAKLSVADIGQMVVEPNSRLRMEASGPGGHRVQLDRGAVSARVYAPPRLFIVDTPAARAVDLGCAYRLSVEDDGSTMLHVTLGYVSLERGGRESIVPAGCVCRTLPGGALGTPYAEQATAEMRKALDRFDRTADAAALDSILLAASKRDSVTLWHLLSRTAGADRERVYARLAKLSPPPAGATRAKLLALDPDALDAWRVEIGGIE